MLLETEILVGDIVELAPHKMSTLDDLDLEKCTVLEIDKMENRIKVVFNNDDGENEIYFNNESTVAWFSVKHVINVERDYKVIEITDNQDTTSGQEVCIISMARIVKQVLQTGSSYRIKALEDEGVLDKFIFMGFSANEFETLLGTVNRISFGQYKIRKAGVSSSANIGWQPKGIIQELDDIFTKLNLDYSGA